MPAPNPDWYGLSEKERNRLSQQTRRQDLRVQRKEKAYRLKTKLEVFDMLGGECAACGIKDHRVLQIDHVIPTGRDNTRKYGQNFYNELLATRDTRNLQLLCANCHMIKTYHE